MLSTSRDTDEKVNDKDTNNRVYSKGPKEQTARESVTAVNEGTIERTSGKGIADTADSKDTSNAAAGEYIVID